MNNRHSILSQALTSKEQELLTYHINITNFKLAIQEINRVYPEDIKMLEYASELRCRLEAEEFEYRKTQIIRDAIALQLKGLDEQ